MSKDLFKYGFKSLMMQLKNARPWAQQLLMK